MMLAARSCCAGGHWAAGRPVGRSHGAVPPGRARSGSVSVPWEVRSWGRRASRTCRSALDRAGRAKMPRLWLRTLRFRNRFHQRRATSWIAAFAACQAGKLISVGPGFRAWRKLRSARNLPGVSVARIRTLLAW